MIYVSIGVTLVCAALSLLGFIEGFTDWLSGELRRHRAVRIRQRRRARRRAMLHEG